MPRILTIVKDLNIGGTQRNAQNCAVGYARSGYQSTVLSINGGGIRKTDLDSLGIEVFVGGSSPEEKRCALSYAKAWQPDIIHIHRAGYSDPITGWVLQTLKESRPQVRVLETNVFSQVDYSTERQLIDVHLHLSQWCLWKWQQWSKIITPEPIGVVVNNMVKTGSFFPASPEVQNAFRSIHHIPQHAIVFGRIGQPLVSKWSPIIFFAFEQIAQCYDNAYLLLVGLPKELKPVLRSLSESVQKRVVEIPCINGDDGLRECYSAMDVFLHASTKGESFGLVLVESMLCECPVISLSTPSKDNSQIEVVGHERGGLIVTDLKSMVHAMKMMIENSALHARLAKSGAKWVRTEYDILLVMETLSKIISIVLETNTHEQLQAKLKSDKDLITQVSHLTIMSMLNNICGKTSYKQKIIMNLVHNPYLYWTYSHLRRIGVAKSPEAIW